ncbi:hypothetical protein PSTG_10278 [Puccinia striiformis f. sp. tritici PST-78]|uniref:DDE Tnp4 domain-containing protein n=1 Tax=Puccinia striiformis f. sp. tritici PST-78 TaxID=1165861 RepID=A0A0L0VAY6_9BASI|nr:hypothetical protein PSTG_10278 [Puccinia striiformis f. sp. tritici PST-78]
MAPFIDPSLDFMAIWLCILEQRRPLQERYIRAIRHAFKRPDRWEPWNDDRIPPIRFIEFFRMPREDFIWLADHLREDLQLDPLRRGDPLSVEAQVAVGLYRLGHGATYVTIGHIFNIGKETADNASARFVTAVLAKFRIQAISFPHLDNPNQWAEIEESFENKHGIPGIVGAIDGTHVPLRKPADDRWKSYINRKSWASIVFQCVVDGEGNFRNVSGGGPGSMHDGRLFRRSALGHNLSQRGEAVEPPMIPRGKYLIGDAGYPANVRVLVPYPSVANPANEDFNFIHSLTRMIVEQAFGWLKNRFRILLHAQLARPIRARNNAFACMVLHNMLNKRGTMYLQVWNNRSAGESRFAELHNTMDDDSTPQTPNGGQPTMASIRDQLREQLCS